MANKKIIAFSEKDVILNKDEKSSKELDGLKLLKANILIETTPKHHQKNAIMGNYYRIVQDKELGVQPGFVCKKVWKPSDEEKLNNPKHKFFGQAEDFQKAYFRENNCEPSPEEIREHIIEKNLKFQKLHFIKGDFKRPLKPGGRVYFGSRAKNPIHNLAKSGTARGKGLLNIKEAMAYELLKLWNCRVSKAHLVLSKYEDGTPKLLLDSTEITNEKRAKYKDFNGLVKDHIIPGQKVGEYPIEPIGYLKIFPYLLADRDAVTSHGQNTGYIIDQETKTAQVWRIDFEQSLPQKPKLPFLETDMMAKNFLRTDFYYKKNWKLIDHWQSLKKNQAIFDDYPLSEKMKGLRSVAQIAKTGEDLKIFDKYIAFFTKENLKDQRLDYSIKLKAAKDRYLKRRDYILNLFKDRLKLNDSELDALDNLEKLTSETTGKSQSGKYDLKYLKTVKQTPWELVKNQDGNYVFSFKASWSQKQKVQKVLSEFLEAHHLSELKNSLNGNEFIITSEQFQQLAKYLNDQEIRKFKNQI